MTLVPAGCRSPGRCCGNHSRQPDGISVGEQEKDGSGSVLPGPARPPQKNNSGPVRYLERERGREGGGRAAGLEVDSAAPGDEIVWSNHEGKCRILSYQLKCCVYY